MDNSLTIHSSSEEGRGDQPSSLRARTPRTRLLLRSEKNPRPRQSAGPLPPGQGLDPRKPESPSDGSLNHGARLTVRREVERAGRGFAQREQVKLDDDIADVHVRPTALPTLRHFSSRSHIALKLGGKQGWSEQARALCFGRARPQCSTGDIRGAFHTNVMDWFTSGNDGGQRSIAGQHRVLRPVRRFCVRFNSQSSVCAADWQMASERQPKLHFSER